MKHTLTTLMLALAIALSASTIAAETRAENGDERRGRDIVQIGTLKTLGGTLAMEGDEWLLKAGDGIYQLHLGPSFFRDENNIALQAGDTAVVTGFADKTDVATVSITIGDKTYRFRDEEGRPLWAGSGRRSRAGIQGKSARQRSGRRRHSPKRGRGRGACIVE